MNRGSQRKILRNIKKYVYSEGGKKILEKARELPRKILKDHLRYTIQTVGMISGFFFCGFLKADAWGWIAQVVSLVGWGLWAYNKFTTDVDTANWKKRKAVERRFSRVFTVFGNSGTAVSCVKFPSSEKTPLACVAFALGLGEFIFGVVCWLKDNFRGSGSDMDDQKAHGEMELPVYEPRVVVRLREHSD